MYKIAVVGDRDSVYGYAALGLETYFAEGENDALRTIRKLERNNYAVIYITEQTAELIPDELRRLSSQPLPAVIPIPGVFGNTGMGMRAVNEAVVKAVGSDIV